MKVNIGSQSPSSTSLSSSSTRSQLPPTPKLALSREQILQELRVREQTRHREIGLVVVGHVDAGKSTLMGRMLVELGNITEREHNQNVRSSSKAGKSSFAYAWSLDSSEEERARGVTIDVAHDTFRTKHTLFHLLDAPGHKDFVPNMISGAAQADAGLLVVDSITGEFEAGFSPQGQTREHATLLRSLGLQQLIVVINKLDAMNYSQQRFDEIVSTLSPFLSQLGFDVNKCVQFVPCAAMMGENLRARSEETSLSRWYTGLTVAEALDRLEQPSRMYESPFRLSVNNVFKGGSLVSSGLGVSGRILSGFVQVGEVVRVLPGDAWGIVKMIECENDARPWAAAGTIVTLYLTHIEPNEVSVGSFLCPPTALVPLCKEIVVQLLTFSLVYPILPGTTVEIFHHSAEIPGQIVELINLLDRASGDVIRSHPRVMSRDAAGTVRVTLGRRGRDGSGFPIEEFKTNKDMARVLFRMRGETVAAGIVLEAK